jgi:RNA polymerase sigma factor (sigma-70 family)
MKRYIINGDIILKRNTLINNIIIDDTVRNSYRFSSYRFSYAKDRDILLSKEDLYQDVLLRLIEQLDRTYVEKKEVLGYYKNSYLISLFNNFIIDSIRAVESAKRGYSRERGDVVTMYIEDLDEGTLNSLQSETGVIDLVLELIAGIKYEDYGLTEKEWSIFVEFFVLGFTFEEIAEKYEMSSRGNARRAATRVGAKMFPIIKSQIDNLLEITK